MKIMSLVRKRSGVSDRELHGFLEGPFRDRLTATAEGEAITRMMYNHVKPNEIRADFGDTEASWAGVLEIWVADEARALELIGHLGGLADAADVPFTLAPAILVREVLMWDRGGKHDAMKVICFFHPRQGLSRIESQHYWNNEHVELGDRLQMGQKLSKYIQNHAPADFHAGTPEFDFAGGPEFWFNDIAEANSLFADQAKLAELGKDEAKFSDQASSIMLVVEERQLFERAAEKATA